MEFFILHFILIFFLQPHGEGSLTIKTDKSIVKYKSKWTRGVLHEGRTIVTIERDGENSSWAKISLTIEGEENNLLQQFLIPAFFPVFPAPK